MSGEHNDDMAGIPSPMKWPIIKRDPIHWWVLGGIAIVVVLTLIGQFGILKSKPQVPKQAVQMPAKFLGAPMLWTGRLRWFVLGDSLPFTIGKNVYYQPVMVPGPGDTIAADSLGGQK